MTSYSSPITVHSLQFKKSKALFAARWSLVDHAMNGVPLRAIRLLRRRIVASLRSLQVQVAPHFKKSCFAALFFAL
jgi:hypothetical protein